MHILEWHLLWDSRNQDRHGRDTTHKKLALHEQAVLELHILYTYQTKVIQRDCLIFNTPIETHKEKNSHHIPQWINTYQAIILKSAKDAKILSLLWMSAHYPHIS
jgi:hypothetical protein